MADFILIMFFGLLWWMIPTPWTIWRAIDRWSKTCIDDIDPFCHHEVKKVWGRDDKRQET